MTKYSTINTFTQKPSPAQLISYLLFLSQILIFYIIIQSRIKSHTSRLTLLIIYSITLLVQICTTLITSISDPSDSVMIAYRNDRNSVRNSQLGNMLYCDICRSYVRASSRHCRACGRCVEGFDHHCMWINNCIGIKNYRIFISMVISTFLAMVIFISSAAVLWAQGMFGQFIGEMVAVWVISAVVLVFIVLIFNLLLLHLYLHYLGITTYEFIVQTRQRQKQEQRRKQQQQRTLQSLQKKQKLNRQLQLEQLNIQKSIQPQQSRSPPQKNSTQKKQTSTSTDPFNKTGSLQLIPKNSNQDSSISISSSSSGKNLGFGFNTSQIKLSKMMPTGEIRNFGREQDEDRVSQADSVSQRESIRISQYFISNKSLAILVKSDVVSPHPQPNTTKHSRQYNKNPFKSIRPAPQ